jgi:cell wall-associated NlpC family hydrolase
LPPLERRGLARSRAPPRFASPKMLSSRGHIRALARLAAALAVGLSLLATGLTAPSSGDLQSQIAAGQSAAATLQSQIAADTARIHQTAGGLQDARASLSALEVGLHAREATLRRVQSALLIARNHLVELENQMRRASIALSDNLIARYENDQPDITTVVVQSNGFDQLLEQLSFLERLGRRDAQVIEFTRTARVAVRHEVAHLASLEERDRTLTDQVRAQRNQVAAWQAALLTDQVAELRTRSNATAKLHTLNSQLQKLEARAAAQAALAAAAARAQPAGPMTESGGVAIVPGASAVDTGAMVQPPPGAPPAVGEVIAAGNAIATLPYVWGGGHGAFRADGYDCSGSVSYALAAAGLVTSPMVSGDFESWGEPGPGRWITVYANATHVWMVVGGWRFDTVAQAYSGTRWAQGGGEFDGFVVRHPPGL